MECITWMLKTTAELGNGRSFFMKMGAKCEEIDVAELKKSNN